jgi:hypothetical protein
MRKNGRNGQARATEGAYRGHTAGKPTRRQEKSIVPKYVIEREIPGAGDFTAEDLKGISQKSCGVLDELGTSIQWIQSFVTADKIYCIYRAANEDLVLRHAEQGGFPANSVARIHATIEPATAE